MRNSSIQKLACSAFLTIIMTSVLLVTSINQIQAEDSGKIKVAVLTNAGGVHLSAYFQSLLLAEEVESVVLADPDGSSVPLAKKILGGKLSKVYTNVDDLLKIEKPVMALISVEAKISPALISTALDAGCHVLAEKPACLNTKDFEKLVVKAKSKKLHLMLALANRLNPEIIEAKRIVSEGLIGKIYGLELSLIEDQGRLKSSSYQKSWFADKNRAGGGHLTWLGIHWLDLSMYITNSKITKVAGFAGNVGGQPINIEDSAVMAIQYDNGTFGTMTSGYYLNKGYQSNIRIWGSHGWLKIDSDASRNVKWYSTKLEGKPTVKTFQGKTHSAYNAFVKAAVRASAGLQDAPITGDECLLVLKTVYGLYEAAESEKIVHVK